MQLEDLPGFTRFVEHAPGRSISNEELEQAYGYSNIESRTGIRRRNWVEPLRRNETLLLDIMTEVIHEICSTLRISASECGALVVASSFPGANDVARRVADLFEITGPVSCENYACSGFPWATQEAVRLAEEERIEKHILIVTAELYSLMINRHDEKTAILFGDRAAATTLHPAGTLKILDAWVRERQMDHDCIWLNEEGNVSMNGKKLFREIPQIMVDAIVESFTDERLGALGLSPIDIHRIIGHQANGRITEQLADIIRSDSRFNSPRVENWIADVGNTASCSIPNALEEIQDTLWEGEKISCPSGGASIGFKNKKGLTEGNVVAEKV